MFVTAVYRVPPAVRLHHRYTRLTGHHADPGQQHIANQATHRAQRATTLRRRRKQQLVVVSALQGLGHHLEAMARRRGQLPQSISQAIAQIHRRGGRALPREQVAEAQPRFRVQVTCRHHFLW